jgi:adenosylcobinamide-GDP ribazoletransferase
VPDRPHDRDRPQRSTRVAVDGIRLAFGTLTVLPVRADRLDRATAAVAMSIAPLIGAVLGAVLAGILSGLTAAGAPRLVAAALTVAVAALLSRGLHLDGLADTVDALGSYRRGPDALAVMKRPDIGPFGVAAVVLTLLIQAAALAVLPPTAVVAGWTAGRLAVPVACRRGVPAARSDGLGAVVAGTVPVPAAAASAAAVALAAAWALPSRPWQGPAAVLAALMVAALVVRHCVRRFGGVTGDVIGAAVEIATTTALVVLTLG